MFEFIYGSLVSSMMVFAVFASIYGVFLWVRHLRDGRRRLTRIPSTWE